MRDLLLAWYGLLSSAYGAVQIPLTELALTTQGGVVAALVLGVLGSLTPCQISTNASSIAYVMARAARSGRRIEWPAAAYVAGKVCAFALIGVLAALMGEGLRAMAVPAIVILRKMLGPLMILIALSLLGVWRPRWMLGQRFSLRLRSGAPTERLTNPFLLGVVYSLAFCPTLALLFFGYLLPMTAASAAGPVLPSAFALGTTFPLVLVVTVMAIGGNAGAAVRRSVTWGPRVQRLAGLVFLVTGIHDTLIYAIT